MTGDNPPSSDAPSVLSDEEVNDYVDTFRHHLSIGTDFSGNLSTAELLSAFTELQELRALSCSAPPLNK